MGNGGSKVGLGDMSPQKPGKLWPSYNKRVRESFNQ